MYKKLLISASCTLLLLASSASAVQETSFKELVSSKSKPVVNEFCSLENSSQAKISPTYAAFNEWRILVAIEKVKQFARNFRRGFFEYIDYYCDRLEKNYKLSCTLNIL